MTTMVVRMSGGRLTLPAELRNLLRLSPDQTFEIEASVEEDAIVLRPAQLMRREDAWAYTPEHQALLAQAREDIRSGRVARISEEDLRRAADVA